MPDNNGWIRITALTLPGKSESVLVYNADAAYPSVKIGFLISTFPQISLVEDEPPGWEFSVSHGVGSSSECPTHWMPLPKSPKQ